MRYLHFIGRHRGIYLRYTFYALLIVESFFALQMFLALNVFHSINEIDPRFAIVPTALGLTVGLLLSTAIALRKDLELRNRLFRAVADFAQEFTYFRRVDGRYEYVSPACETVTGHSPAAFYIQPNFMNQLIHPDDRKKWGEHVHRMNTDGHPEEILVRILNSVGEERWISHLCSDVRDDDGSLLGVRSTNLDVTQRINYERDLQRLADYDPLTDLPNRRQLMRKIEALVPDCRNGSPFAVMFLDLDSFKNLNDTHGHTFGDEVLRVLAGRMRQYCADDAFLCRFGGDEFVIVVPGVDTPEVASNYAKHLLDMIEQPFLIRAQRFFISGSIGISLCPDDSESPDVLIRNADVAMYRAKLDGRASIGFFSRELVDHAVDFLKLETQLRDSLEAGALQLHYQPRIRLADGAVVGAEALARWFDNDEWISPGRFIPVAEDSGLIDRLTEQLLGQAARQAQRWPGLRISFNLSGQQFRRPDLCVWIHGVVLAAGCMPERIELEVTEGILLNSKQDAADKLAEFRRLGYRIALDDFGTGFSSLSYLRDMHFDIIKLDGSFVRGMADNGKDMAVVRAVASLCQETGMEVVAEGIETEEQLATVRALGIEEGQGYLLARPMPAAEMDAFLEKTGMAATPQILST
ncbi:MAG: hypothetical protein B7Y41_08735 [Hydrogenophilales bacterium 28-61-23]|nr:MAG: hypothetical protein B7Y41_08735 [Hydrogenophilales bacterium 28-61-23]